MTRRFSGRKNTVEHSAVKKEVLKGPRKEFSPDTQNRGIKVGAYIALGIAAAVFGALAYDKPEKKGNSGDDLIQTSTEGNKTRLTPSPENLGRYECPEGAIIKSRRFFPGVNRTLIFVPEMHKSTTSVSGLLENEEKSAYKVHEQKFLIIADLVRKFGKMPIVLEAWMKELNRLDVTKDSRYQTVALRRLGTISNLDERIRFGQKLAATTRLPAYLVALHVFGKDLPPIGSVSDAELNISDQSVKKIQDFVTLVTSQKSIYQDPRSGHGYTVMDVLAGYDKPDGRELLLPYCSLRQMSDEIIAELDDRKNSVPKKEIDAAISLPEQVVLVSSGEQHNHVAIQELQKTHAANYLVIVPLELEKFIKRLDDKDKKGEFASYPDTPAGDCEKLEQSSRALISQTIRQMISRAQ